MNSNANAKSVRKTTIRTMQECMAVVSKHSLRIRGHQYEGIKWLISEELGVRVGGPNVPEGFDRPRGGILADDMGTGKTLQMLMTIHANPQPYPTLIVVPCSVLRQWVSETIKFIGVKPLAVEARNISAWWSAILRGENQIIITTHSAASLKIGDDSLLKQRFSRIIIDESQAIKNRQTRLHQNMLTVQAPIKWCVTGTPVLSKLEDFYAQLSFTGWGFLTAEESKKCVLRRTKEQIEKHMAAKNIHLPSITIENHVIILDDDSLERHMYHHYHAQGVAKLNEYDALKRSAVTNKTVKPAPFRFELLNLCLKMRQSLVHPAAVMWEEYGDYESAKQRALVKLFARHPKEARSLVFCNWHAEAAVVASSLHKAYPDLVIVNFNGSMTLPDRQRAVDMFMSTSHSKDIAMIVQIDAGGVGINLQMAGWVYIVSPHWNAANEMQAIDRAHRWNAGGVGMPTHINVTRLVVDNTIESKIHLGYQAKKLEIMADIFDEEMVKQKFYEEGDAGPSKPTWDQARSVFDVKNLVDEAELVPEKCRRYYDAYKLLEGGAVRKDEDEDDDGFVVTDGEGEESYGDDDSECDDCDCGDSGCEDSECEDAEVEYESE